MNAASAKPAAAEGSIGRRALKGAAWSGVNTLFMKFANIAVMIVVVRVVTPQDFGIFAVALVVHAVVSSIGELGLSSCISRRDMDPEKVAPTVALLSLASSLGLAIAMALSADHLAVALGSAEAADPIRVLSLSVFLGGAFTVPGALLVREFRQDKVLLAGAIAFVPMNGLFLLLALAGDGAMAFAWSRVVGQLISGVVMTMAVSRRYWPRLAPAEIGPVLRFGLPLAGANLLSYILLNADYAIVARSLGPSELGIYMLAFTIASWSTSVLSTTINSVAMPAFSASGGDISGLQLMAGKAFVIVAAIAFPIGAMTVALAEPLVSVLYGDKWLPAAPVLSILAVYGAIFSVSLLMSNLLVATGRSSAVIIVQALWIASLVPIVLIAVTSSGLLGVAYAHVIVAILIVIPSYILFVRRILPTTVSLLIKSMGAPFGASVAAGVFAAWLSVTSGSGLAGLLVGGSAGMFSYLLLILPTARGFLPEQVGGKTKHLADTYDRLRMAVFAKLRFTGRRYGS